VVQNLFLKLKLITGI